MYMYMGLRIFSLGSHTVLFMYIVCMTFRVLCLSWKQTQNVYTQYVLPVVRQNVYSQYNYITVPAPMVCMVGMR